MAYIRVPTGLSQHIATCKIKNKLRYTCCHCGRETEHPYVIVGHGARYVYFLQSRAKKAELDRQATEEAERQAYDQLHLAMNRINELHQYDMITEKIECPYCQKVQPWSDQAVKKSGWNLVPAILFNIFFVEAIVALLINAQRDTGFQSVNIASYVILLLVPAAISAFFYYRYFGSAGKTKRARNRIYETAFIPPELENVQECYKIMISGKKADSSLIKHLESYMKMNGFALQGSAFERKVYDETSGEFCTWHLRISAKDENQYKVEAWTTRDVRGIPQEQNPFMSGRDQGFLDILIHVTDMLKADAQ